ncbi:hypothetical protein Patl1_03399 [Pistacia atlantica]|uniref:Uncharacterized protein n=1 Tax=Pistacia atlantica TaxID=434234 RepID=A0ACC1CAJ7_9ROSI|nr:hypothetical protein Patl1_03399 [Pistacia atlantica]
MLLRSIRATVAAARVFSTKAEEVKTASGATTGNGGGGGRDTLGRRLLSLVYTKRSAAITVRKWKEEGHTVRKYELNRIVRELRKLKRYKHALEELKKNTLPDVVTYNLWLTVCASQNDIETAEKVFLELKKAKLDPDWVTYSALTSMYIKNELPEKAESTLKEMEKRASRKNRIAYSSLLSLHTNMGDKDGVQRIWKKMQSLFRKMNDAEYTCMISSLVKLGELKKAENLYNEWESSSGTGDARVPNILLAAYINKNQMEKADTFYSRMVQKDIKPCYTTWELLTWGYLEKSHMKKVLDCFQKAIGSVKKWNPDKRLVTKVFKKIEEQGNIEAAEQLLVILRNAGYVTTEMYNSLLRTYEKAGKMPLIVAERMEKDNVQLNADTHKLIKTTSTMPVTEVSSRLSLSRILQKSLRAQDERRVYFFKST